MSFEQKPSYIPKIDMFKEKSNNDIIDNLLENNNDNNSDDDFMKELD